jgi:enoyl-CoA hydratase/carnithine racemase
MGGNVVLLAIEGPVATYTLNRPKSLNAMSRAMVSGLEALFAQIQQMEVVRVAIVTGAGRDFCAGADLNDIAVDENIF